MRSADVTTNVRTNNKNINDIQKYYKTMQLLFYLPIIYYNYWFINY